MSTKIVKTNKLALFILVILTMITVVILMNYFSFLNIRLLLIDEIKNNQLTKTNYIARQIESHIYLVKDELVTLSRFPLMKTLDINQCSGDMKIIHTHIEGEIDSLLRVDSEGNIIECSSPLYSNYLGLNIKNKEYFKYPKENNEPYISGIEKQGSSMLIYITAPLYETTEYTPYPNFLGKFEGELLSIIEVSTLYDSYIYPNLNNDKSLFFLFNYETNETILKSDKLSNYSNLIDYSTNENQIINFDDYGQTIITSSNLTIGPEKWSLIFLTPLSNIGKEIELVQLRHLVSLGFIIIVMIIVITFMYTLYKSKEEVQTKLNKTKVTLDELGINIEIEKDKFNQADLILKPKKIYLIKEDEENHAHELFINSLSRGFAGLGIIRDNPKLIKKKYNLKKTSFIWLTKNKIEGIPCETKISNLYNLISEFIKKSKKSVILIDRLDYIITENDFNNVLKAIHSLKDLAQNHKCIIILSVNPELIKESNIKAIAVETVDLYGKHLKNKVNLSDLEMNILNYVNEKNVVNKLASYKDITTKFKITKPTTRVKISKLQQLGLVQVEHVGRFKSIKITSAGRRIIR